mgnify:CR=1 FL=1
MVRRTADSGRDENAKWRGKNLFHVPENAERKIFRFGARSEKFTNQNEKIQARIFPKNRTAISSFFVRDFSVSGYSSTEFLHLFP